MTRVMSALLAALLLGCVPVHETKQTRIVGSVVDAKKQGPIAAAELHCEKYPANVARTDASGTFEIPPLKEWQWAPLGGDLITEECTLVAEAKGYRSTRQRVWYGDDRPQTVRLEPEQ